MGIRAQGNPLASFLDVWSNTGLDAVTAAPGSAPASSDPDGHTATGGIISDWVDPSPGNVYRAHIFTSSGTFAVSALSGTYPDSMDYLVVGGGGGGGTQDVGGGGGAGGFLTSTGYSASIGSYTVIIGAGGIGGSPAYPVLNGDGEDGANSDFYPTPVSHPSPTYLRAVGGGGGGSGNQSSGPGAPTYHDARPGGSGGGGGWGGGSGASGTSGQGNAGGNGNGSPSASQSGGGGGGAGGAGGTNPAPNTTGGSGGVGSPNVYAYGPSNPETYAGGGGGGGDGGGGTGGSSIGGAGGPSGAAGNNAVVSTGSGGGGVGGACPASVHGGDGSSGIVVVRYQIGTTASNAKATGGAISLYNNKWIHTFVNSGVFTVKSSEIPSAEIFVVAGGGGGGGYAAGDGGSSGGGAGGLCVHPGRPLAASTAYPISIGAGGVMARVSNGNKVAVNGVNTVFTDPSAPGTITAVGGGYGRGQDGSAGGAGGSGGGGAGGGSPPGGPGGPGTQSPSGGATGYGNDGGDGQTGSTYRGGGGGGAGAAGADGPAQPGGGPGGYGIQAPPSFRDPASTVGDVGTYGSGTAPTPGGFWFAGGGGSSGSPYNTTLGAGGAGGGGQGYHDGAGKDLDANTAGKTSTGGGGGGYQVGASPYMVDSGNANGGSGIVLIAYPN